jgi:hypothetical protein
MHCRNSWRQRQWSPPKLPYLSVKLHVVTSQKTVILIFIIVKKILDFRKLAWYPALVRTGYRSNPYVILLILAYCYGQDVPGAFLLNTRKIYGCNAPRYACKHTCRLHAHHICQRSRQTCTAHTGNGEHVLCFRQNWANIKALLISQWVIKK